MDLDLGKCVSEWPRLPITLSLNAAQVHALSLERTVPEFTDPVFAKTSPKRSFSIIENERFGLLLFGF
jgi:hypothetical protein